MLRPIDVTLTIQHAADAQRANANNSQSARPEVMQKIFAEKLEEELRQQQRQATEVDRSEKSEVHRDRKGDGTGYQGNRKRPAKKATGNSRPGSLNDYGKESMYDIKV